jgi:hypothetical protein
MAGISIIVEGSEDIRFLQDFIRFHFNSNLNKDSFIEIEGKSEKLHLSRTKIQSSSSKGNKNILFFDADDKDFASTIRKVKSKESELQLNFDHIFLFPDNTSKGNLETLLLSCIPERNKGLFDCIKDYSSCKEALKLELSRKIDEKEKLYIYHGSFDESGKSTATQRSYLIDHIWNLKAKETNKLKDFLAPFLEIVDR